MDKREKVECGWGHLDRVLLSSGEDDYLYSGGDRNKLPLLDNSYYYKHASRQIIYWKIVSYIIIIDPPVKRYFNWVRYKL